MNYKDYSFVSTYHAYFSYELHLYLFDRIVFDTNPCKIYEPKRLFCKWKPRENTTQLKTKTKNTKGSL